MQISLKTFMRFTVGLLYYLMFVNSKLRQGIRDKTNYLYTRNQNLEYHFKLSRTFLQYVSGSDQVVEEQTAEEVSEQAEMLLLWLTGKLKSFITTKEFYLDGFQRGAEELGKEKFRIGEMLGKIFPSTQILNKLWFAQQMYDSMFNSFESLKFFSIKSEISLYYVHQLIILNIKLYRLFDNEGNPDPTIESFAESVRDHKSYLKRLDSAYEKLPRKPVLVKLYYENQFYQATSRLRILSTYPSRLNSSTTPNVPFPFNLPWLLIGNHSLQNFISFLP